MTRPTVCTFKILVLSGLYFCFIGQSNAFTLSPLEYRVCFPADTAGKWPSKSPGLAVDSVKYIAVTGGSKVSESRIKERKRIWRRIDTRQKMNRQFQTSTFSMAKFLMDLAVSGKVKVYETDALDSVLNKNQIVKAGEQKITTLVFRPGLSQDPTDLKDTTYYKKADSKDVLKFDVLEEMYFDAHEGTNKFHIVAIAPILSASSDIKSGKLATDKALYWFRMEEIKPFLAAKAVTDSRGLVLNLNWDQLFNKYRLFDGYILKESNAADAAINASGIYKTSGLDALLQSEEIKNDLFIFQYDLWEY